MIIPQTEWLAPTEYPDLRSANEIAIDLETRDPDLKKLGSGAITSNGEVVGIAVAVDGWKGYFPIAHEVGPNLDRKKVLDWFKQTSFYLENKDKIEVKSQFPIGEYF